MPWSFSGNGFAHAHPASAKFMKLCPKGARRFSSWGRKKNSLRRHYLKNPGKPLHLTRWQIFTNLPKSFGCWDFLGGEGLWMALFEAEARASNAASMLGAQLFWCRAANFSLRCYKCDIVETKKYPLEYQDSYPGGFDPGVLGDALSP